MSWPDRPLPEGLMDIVGISDFVNTFSSDYEAIADIKAPK
jgi:hypothetical protein